MKWTVTICVMLLLAPLAALQAADPPQAAAKPSIMAVLAGDLGDGDIGCYGAMKIATPNIDRLAREGVKFTDAHTAASACSPPHSRRFEPMDARGTSCR